MYELQPQTLLCLFADASGFTNPTETVLKCTNCHVTTGIPGDNRTLPYHQVILSGTQ